MKSLSTYFFAATAAICLTTIPSTAQNTDPSQMQIEEKTTMSKEQQAVLNAIITMTEAFHKGDIDAVMASYTPEATVVFDRQKPIAGYAAIKGKFLEIFAIKPHFEYSGHEVFIAGDSALHIAPWVMHATLPDGQAIQDSGLSVASLKRQADGRWLMVIDDPYGSFLQQ